MSAQVILPDLFSATSLPALAVGATPCALPDGPRIDLFGRAVAPANLLAQPVPGAALPTNAISGLSGSTSSASADLTLSLVSRLKQRLTTDGSTLFNLTWREKVTPAGRLVYRLAASGRRTSDKDSGSWPTPLLGDAHLSSTPEAAMRRLAEGRPTVSRIAALTSWPTPQAMDTMTPRDPATFDKWNNERDGRKNRKFVSNLPQAVLQHMGSWPTTTVTDAHRGERYDPMAKNMTLNMAAQRTSWPTTSTRDYKGGYQGGAHEERQDQPRRIGRGGAINFWSDCDWLPCRDGKARPVEPGTFPLAHGVSARVGRLRAYGNAIVPQVAQVFIEAYLET